MTLLVATLVTAFSQTDVGQRLEWSSVDLRYQLRGERKTTANVAVVAIDDKTVAAWTEPSVLWGSRIAKVIDNAMSDEPSHLALDMLFEDDFDEFFSEAFGEAAPTSTLDLETALFSYPGKVSIAIAPDGGQLASLQEAVGDSVGTIELPVQPDDSIRIVFGEDRASGLRGLASVATGNQSTPELIYLNYIGARVQHLSAVEVENGTASIAPGSYLVVGATYRGSGDTHATPYSRTMSGAEVLANAIATILDHRPLRPLGLGLAFLITLIVAGSATVIALRFKPSRSSALLIFFGIILVCLTQALFVNSDVLFPFTPALLSLAIAGGAGFVTRAHLELSDRLQLRTLFGSFLAPQVSDFLLEKGSKMGEPERFWAAMLVLDVRGFTTMAETAKPEQLVADLNELWNVLLPIVERHGGHVNNFAGDGFLALFGVPVPEPNPERNAVNCAVELLQKVEAQDEWRIGIGVHAGRIVAGCMGSKTRFTYTVLGDAVNVCARLQDLTKEVGHPILISEEALAGEKVPGLKGPFELAIRGRNAGLRAWGMISSKEEVSLS